PPPKKMVTSGKEAVKLTVSGQVNRMVLFADDGVEDEIFHVDNVNSGTRVRFVGKARLSPEWSSGIRVEFNLRENRSDKVCIQTGDRAKAECDKGVAGADKDAAFDTSERFLEWTVTSKTLGKLYIGQGDTASNSTNHVNFSGTLMPDFTGAQLVGGGIQFRDADTDETFGTDINDTFADFDGLSRRNRIRYDTPTFVGFKASASHIQGDAWDVALRYAAKIPGFKLGAAIAFAEATNRFGFDQVNGSASILHEPSGVSLTFAAGERDLETRGREDPLLRRVVVGYQFKATPLGKTFLSASFSRVDDFQKDGDESATWAVTVLQKIDKFSMELYAGFRNWDLTRRGRDVEDINLVFSGARIKF
ncbi:MAG: porin, partial [Nitrospinota bacterium]